MKLWIEEALGFHLNWWQRLWLWPTDRKWRRQYAKVLRIVDEINQVGAEDYIPEGENEDETS